MKRVTDKMRLNWLSKNCSWVQKHGLVGVLFLPIELENSQTVRLAIDAAIRAQRKLAGEGK